MCLSMTRVPCALLLLCYKNELYERCLKVVEEACKIWSERDSQHTGHISQSGSTDGFSGDHVVGLL